MLQCGHRFCSRCLEDFISSILQTRDSFECPICRSKYDIEPNTEPRTWINNLRTDDISLSILQAIGLNRVTRTTDTKERVNQKTTEVADEPVFNINSLCGRHFDKKLDVYCSKHDVVVCAECAWKEHRNPECDCLPAAKVIEKRFSALKCLVAQQMADATKLLDAKGQEQDNKTVEHIHADFQKSISEVEESFKEVCSVFNKRIESLRIKAKQTVDLNSSVVSVKDLQSKLAHQVKSFDDVTSNKNPNETMRQISDMCSKSSELQESIHELSNIINNGTLMKFADADLNILDAFVSSTKQTIPEEFLPYEELAHENDSEDSKDFVMVTKSGQCLDKTDDIGHESLAWTKKYTFSTKLEGELTCMLSGIALIGTVAIVVVDQSNKCIKKFKIPEGRFLNDLSVKYEPHQIASIQETSTVAVTVWDIPKVLIVGTDPVLEILRVVNTENEYIGVISHKADCLAVSSINARRVDILDIRPSNIQDPKQATIYQSSRKRSFPDRLTSTRGGNVVVRVRHRNEISCFGVYHNLLWSRRLKTRIADIACFRSKIFATLRDKNDIVYFREDGMGDLNSLKKDGDLGIKKPWSLDGFKDCLVVTEDSPSDLVHVFVF